MAIGGVAACFAGNAVCFGASVASGLYSGFTRWRSTKGSGWRKLGRAGLGIVGDVTAYKLGGRHAFRGFGRHFRGGRFAWGRAARQTIAGGARYGSCRRWRYASC